MRITSASYARLVPTSTRCHAVAGLDKYAPAESRAGRALTRFPNRNKFISDYIQKKTGQIRTAKQVGSRIQQLRDAPADETGEPFRFLTCRVDAAGC